MPLAIFGIEHDGVNLAVNLLILFLVVVYVALIAYTYLDARRRLDDQVLVGCATVAALFPFLGTMVYTILRPPEFLADQRERALEIRASELRVRQLEEASCPNCEHPVERTYLRCPNCRARIKDPCDTCAKPVDPRWSICPYCESPTRRGASERAASSSQRPPRSGGSGSRAQKQKRPSQRTVESAAARPKPRGKGSRPPVKAPAQARAQSDPRRRGQRPDDGPRSAPAS